MSQRILFFTHIPKTAGTSFRLSVENSLEPQEVIRDYGINFEETSDLVREFLQKEGENTGSIDLYPLIDKIQKSECKFITGHVSAKKYLAVSSLPNLVSFVRNPVDQVISHWRHYKKYHGYEYDLETFCQEERFINKQSKTLSLIPPELIGCLMVTEKYKESIDMFNHQYQMNVSVLKENITRRDSGDNDVDKRLRNKIKQLNKKDFLLYEKANQILDQKNACFQNGHAWVYGMGRYRQAQKIITGVAYRDDYQIVDLALYVNGEKVDEIASCQRAPHFDNLPLPRYGYVRFRFDLSSYDDIQNYKVVVQGTEQELRVDLAK